MAKKIPAAEFKEAVKAINTMLKKEEKPPIKIVGVKKEVIVENFINVILDYNERGEEDSLPDVALDFYNNHIAADDEDEPEEKPAAKGKGKGKGKSAAKPKAKPKEKKDGICVSAIKAYMEKGITSKQDIIDYVQPNFPDRQISKTISHVYGVLRHIKPYPKK